MPLPSPASEDAPGTARSARRAAIVLWSVVLLLVAGTSALRLRMAGVREYDPDEFQHLHAAWCISQGLVPYRDFYEHHMPGLALVLPALVSMPTDRSTTQDILGTIHGARLLSWAWALGVLGVTAALARTIAGATASGVAVALLTTGVVLTGKGLEIRPDGAATFFWILGLWLMVDSLRRPSLQLANALASGLALGTSLLLTQKLLLALPGVLAAAIWAWFLVDRPESIGRRVAGTVVQLSGIALPMAILTSWFARHEAATVFLRSTVVQNVGWIREASATSTLAWIALRDPFFVVVGGVGLAGWLVVLLRSPRTASPGPVVLVCATVSLVAGLFVIPAPYPQYTLPVFPLAAVGAATWIGSPRPVSRGWVLAVSAVALAATLALARPFFAHALVYPAVFAASLALAASCRERTAAVAVILMAASLYPAQQLRWMVGLSNERQVETMAFVRERTSAPDATVLDGFSGLGWFRMHAWTPHFLHAGVRARLTPADQRQLADGLSSGRISPAVVLFDEHLRHMSPAVVEAITSRYRPTTTDPVWVPREGPTPPPLHR